MNLPTYDLDIYAKNFPIPSYLSFLDAVFPEWTAPDWVYQKTRKLQTLDFESQYAIMFSVSITNGLPIIRIVGDTMDGFGNAFNEF